MQLASEAALAAPTEAEATGPAANTEVGNYSRTKFSLQNLMMLSHGGPGTASTSFAPTKSVRTLARYLDMCILRQQELYFARLISSASKSKQFRTQPPQPTTNHRKQNVPASTPTSASGQQKLPPPLLPKVKNSDQNKSAEKIVEKRKQDSQGANCFDIICCCGLLSWCFRGLKNACCGRKTKRLKHKKGCKGCPCNKSRNGKSATEATYLSHLKTGNNIGIKSVEADIMKHMNEETIRDQVYCRNITCPGCACGAQSKGNQKPKLSRGISFCRSQGNFLVRLHLFVKLLYLFNVVGQIYLLEYYTGVKYNFYGIRVLYDLVRGRHWEETGHFPRVTFCDFEARKLGRSH